MLYKEKLFAANFIDATSNIKKLIIIVEIKNKIFVAEYDIYCIYCKFARTCSGTVLHPKSPINDNWLKNIFNYGMCF